ncbi:hypothetical protein CRUP_030369 [Coryphaenoides rupestris]|nr:hypothetical protein CRUP_030369 [Coryphaenoides rupestris]
MAACTAAFNEAAIIRCVELLLSRHADPNMGDGSGMSCVMQAARDGYGKVVILLVAHGAHVDTQDAQGYTALALATQYGRAEAAFTLLQLGADQTIRTKDGESPADIALAYKHTRHHHRNLSHLGKGHITEDIIKSAEKFISDDHAVQRALTRIHCERRPQMQRPQMQRPQTPLYSRRWWQTAAGGLTVLRRGRLGAPQPDQRPPSHVAGP